MNRRVPRYSSAFLLFSRRSTRIGLMNKIVIFQITFATDSRLRRGDRAITLGAGERVPFFLFHSGRIRGTYSVRHFSPNSPGSLGGGERPSRRVTRPPGVSSGSNDLSRACRASKQLSLMKTKQTRGVGARAGSRLDEIVRYASVDSEYSQTPYSILRN